MRKSLDWGEGGKWCLCAHGRCLCVSHMSVCVVEAFVCVVYVCVYTGLSVCVCACVHVSMCALCMSAHLSAHTEVLGSALKGSRRSRGQLGPWVQCSLRCSRCPPFSRKVPSPAPPHTVFLSISSCN